MTNSVGADAGSTPAQSADGPSAPVAHAGTDASASGPGTPDTRARRRRRRPAGSVAGAVSGILTYALVAACALIPVPYLIQTPGPVVNTLAPVEGKELITITGAETYEAEGQLDMLTVAVSGGPGNSVYASQALRALIARTDTVVPTETFYPLTATREDVRGQNSAQMASSQDTATAAALTELDIDYSSVTAVAEVVAGSPADGQVLPGDVIVSVDGTDLAGDPEAAVRVAEAVKSASGPVTLGIERAGESSEVEVEPTAMHGQQMIGISMQQTFDFPFDVSYNVEDIGGPSAGMIFALTIIDELTPGNLTGEVPIAGTGAIDVDGTVSPIGGARQKVAAASAAGAEYFLSPAGNCAEVLTAADSTDLHVVRVDTLSDARHSIEQIAAGTTDSLPQCTSGNSKQ